MNLIVDFGNTRIKAALYTTSLVELKVFDSVSELLADTDFTTKATHCIVASVTNTHVEFVHELEEKLPILLFSSTTALPITNAYKSQQTLGSDRIAASIGGFALHPNTNVLTIDAGTCIKYNFLDANNIYHGGAISPGLQMRFRALNHFTGRLPLVSLDDTFDKLIGENTQESILSGVINGSIFEIDQTINAYREKYADLTILITGGDAPFLAKRLKNPIFAHPNLVLSGLNTLLTHYREYNKK
jgi:type III pantothenate kinase